MSVSKPLSEPEPLRDPMAWALELAEAAIGLTEPNPRVGCVLTSADGLRLLGQGHTQETGGPHAEVMALRDAQARGETLRGATAYVTLEPCSHHGRTPPCCDALIAAGLARVVVAAGDPNPLVNGQGIARLRAAGLRVDMAPLAQAQQSRELNIGFFSRMQRQRPWVRMKMAASLDGITALANGKSQWITGAEARRDGQAWRRRAAVVLSGIGTVLADDPRLDVRDWPVARQPLRAVVDSSLRTPHQARIFESGEPVLLYHAQSTPERQAELESRSAELVWAPGPNGQVDLHRVLADLARRSVNELHVEAGATLNAAWLAAGLVDELLIYLAPVLLGNGRGMSALAGLTELDQGLRWHFVEATPVGQDLRLRARRAPPEA